MERELGPGLEREQWDPRLLPRRGCHRYPVARVPWSKHFCAPRSNTLAPSWDSSSGNWAFDETASISKPLTKLGGWKTIQMRRFYHFGYFPNRVSCFRRFPQEVGFQNFGAQICKMDLRASGFKVAWLGKWSQLLKGLVEKCSGSKMFQKCVPEHRAPAVFWEGAGPERWVKRGPAGRAVPPWGVCVPCPLTGSGGPASPARVCGLFSSSRLPFLLQPALRDIVLVGPRLFVRAPTAVCTPGSRVPVHGRPDSEETSDLRLNIPFKKGGSV